MNRSISSFKTSHTFSLIAEVSKENAFNFLRLACCLVVIYEHCVVLSGANLPCFDLRAIAVNVFFVLSGFWVTLSYLKKSSVKEYALKRCKKILPLYWLVVLGSAFLLSAFSKLEMSEYFSDAGFFKYLLTNLLTFNFVQPSLPGVFEGLALGGSVNGSLWTIKIEIGFYVVLPALIFVLRRLPQKTSGGGKCIVIILLLYLLSVLYEVFMPKVCKMAHLPSSLANQFPSFFSYFESGMIFALFGKKFFPLLKILILPCATIFAFLNIFKFPFVSSFLSPFCLSVIVMFLGLNLKIFSNVGRKTDYSYSLYLVHYPLAMCFVSLGFFENKPVFAIFSVLGTSFLCAYLLENFQKILFEKNSESAAAGSVR